MVDVALGEYLAYCFIEAVKAREMSDDYSRAVAERYAQDPVLSQFPTPRFKIPRIELTIPVVITDAKLADARSEFSLPKERFVRLLLSRAGQARRLVERFHGPFGDRRSDPSLESEAGRAVERLYDELLENPDPSRPDDIVRAGWAEVFSAALAESESGVRLMETDEARRVLHRSTEEVLETVRAHTVVQRAALERLLVDPLTRRVRDESTGDTVFSVRAELHEDGFAIHRIRDEETGTERPVVDFE